MDLTYTVERGRRNVAKAVKKSRGDVVPRQPEEDAGLGGLEFNFRTEWSSVPRQLKQC